MLTIVEKPELVDGRGGMGEAAASSWDIRSGASIYAQTDTGWVERGSSCP